MSAQSTWSDAGLQRLAAALSEKPTHTPGPWHRNIAPAGKYNVVWSGRNTHVAAVKTEGLTEAEIEANINLIAASPAMLKALRMARGQVAEDREALFACHKSHASGKVEDALGKAALRQYDRILMQIDDAIDEATGVAS